MRVRDESAVRGASREEPLQAEVPTAMLSLLSADPPGEREEEREGEGEGWPQSVHAPAAAIRSFQHEWWKTAAQEEHCAVGVNWQGKAQRGRTWRYGRNRMGGGRSVCFNKCAKRKIK